MANRRGLTVAASSQRTRPVPTSRGRRKRTCHRVPRREVASRRRRETANYSSRPSRRVRGRVRIRNRETAPPSPARTEATRRCDIARDANARRSTRRASGFSRARGAHARRRRDRRRRCRRRRRDRRALVVASRRARSAAGTADAARRSAAGTPPRRGCSFAASGRLRRRRRRRRRARGGRVFFVSLRCFPRPRAAAPSPPRPPPCRPPRPRPLPPRPRRCAFSGACDPRSGLRWSATSEILEGRELGRREEYRIGEGDRTRGRERG